MRRTVLIFTYFLGIIINSISNLIYTLNFIVILVIASAKKVSSTMIPKFYERMKKKVDVIMLEKSLFLQAKGAYFGRDYKSFINLSTFFC